mmetsp:Transcript_1381/g.3894  ORF Transcript_1381/g.3894 Transcript_1381/m.3894 type:complete len:101 (+) Transcript_1381:242-544(+)
MSSESGISAIDADEVIVSTLLCGETALTATMAGPGTGVATTCRDTGMSTEPCMTLTLPGRTPPPGVAQPPGMLTEEHWRTGTRIGVADGAVATAEGTAIV